MLFFILLICLYIASSINKKCMNKSCTKINAARIKKLLGFIGQGLGKSQACYASGITRQTLYRWLKIGQEDSEAERDTLYCKLYEGIPTAEAECELVHLKNITEAGKRDWRASAWYIDKYLMKQRETEEEEDSDELIIIG